MVDWKIHVRTQEQVDALRARLVEFLCDDFETWPTQDGDRLRFPGPYDTRFEAKHYSRGHKRAIVYCEGHYGHYRNSLEAINTFLDHGCDVIAMAMPLNEPNSKGFYERPLLTHYDLERTPKPIWPFIYPWQVLLEWAAAVYGWENLSIGGISGGGWSCMLYAALDPRVRASYPVAGVRYDPNYGGERGWKYVGVMRQALSCLATSRGIGGWFDVWIDDTHKDHKCSAWAAAKIAGDMRCK